MVEKPLKTNSSKNSFKDQLSLKNRKIFRIAWLQTVQTNRSHRSSSRSILFFWFFDLVILIEENEMDQQVASHCYLWIRVARQDVWGVLRWQLTKQYNDWHWQTPSQTKSIHVTKTSIDNARWTIFDTWGYYWLLLLVDFEEK